VECRKCGACCIAPSISSPIPSLPNGKPKEFRCPHLNENNLCNLYDSTERPLVCSICKPDPDFCGKSFEEAVKIFSSLE